MAPHPRDVFRSIAPALTLLLAVAGCGRPATSAVRVDVLAYLERARTWAPVEGETARTIDRIFRTQFVDEAEVNRQIAESRPRVQRHLTQVKEYAPRSQEVERIHREYVDAWELLLKGYEAIERGFSTGDYTNLARGREALEGWRDGIVQVAQDIRQLASELNVDPSQTTVS